MKRLLFVLAVAAVLSGCNDREKSAAPVPKLPEVERDDG